MKRCPSVVFFNDVDCRPGCQESLDATNRVDGEVASYADLDDLRMSVVCCIVKRCPSSVICGIDTRITSQELLHTQDTSFHSETRLSSTNLDFLNLSVACCREKWRQVVGRSILNGFFVASGSLRKEVPVANIVHAENTY